MTAPHSPSASSSPQPIDVVQLGRYLDGTASTEERAVVEAWVGSDADRRAALASLHAAWSADSRRLGASYDAEAALARLWAGLPADRESSSRLGWSRWLAAAAIVVALGAGARWWIGSHQPTPPPVAQAPTFREYATPRGRRAVFRLLDGTEITLNADSRLRVPSSFGGSAREVYLEGEAFFIVVHDTARAFAVHTRRGSVRDVGTRFNVNAYADVSADRVAVEDGAVDLAAAQRADTGSTRLRAGQVGAVSADGRVRVLARAAVGDELAWTRGRLAFRAVPLGEAALRLGRWYDLDIRVTDSDLARRSVTGSYGSEPVTEILDLLTAAVGARYAWHGRTVTITTQRERF
jgi:transmembrane sensor